MSSWDASLLTFVDSCSVGDFGTAAQAVLAMAEILDAAPAHYAPLISPRAGADRIAELLAADAPLCAAMELVGPLCGVLLSRSAGGTASGMVKIIDEVAKEFTTHSMASGMKDHDWGIQKLKEAGVIIKTIDPAAKKAWAEELKDWPNERAQAVKKKKGIDMPTIMRAYIQMQKDDGHKFPVDYVIK